MMDDEATPVPAPFTVNELTTLLVLVEEDIARLLLRGNTKHAPRQMSGLADRVRLHLDAAKSNATAHAGGE